MVPGEKTLGLKRISKIMSLTEPTSLQAARTASVARESPASIQTFVSYKRSACIICSFCHSVRSTETCLTSCGTFFKASILVQYLPDTLSELAMSKKGAKKQNFSFVKTLSKVEFKEFYFHVELTCAE